MNVLADTRGQRQHQPNVMVRIYSMYRYTTYDVVFHYDGWYILEGYIECGRMMHV